MTDDPYEIRGYDIEDLDAALAAADDDPAYRAALTRALAEIERTGVTEPQPELGA